MSAEPFFRATLVAFVAGFWAFGIEDLPIEGRGAVAFLVALVLLGLLQIIAYWFEIRRARRKRYRVDGRLRA